MCTDLWKLVQLLKTEQSPLLSAAVNTNSWQSQRQHSLTHRNLGGKGQRTDKRFSLLILSVCNGFYNKFKQKGNLKVAMSYLELWTSACLHTSLQREQCCWEGWKPGTSAPRLPPNSLEEPWRQTGMILKLIYGQKYPQPLISPVDLPDLSRRIWSFWHSSINPEMRLANSTTYWIAWVIWMAHCCHSTSRGYKHTLVFRVICILNPFYHTLILHLSLCWYCAYCNYRCVSLPC